MDREREIVRASGLSIVGNLVLAGAKGIAGYATGSIAITLDAVNSLTDALASIIAVIGTKLANKPADHNHPFGFGRVEYLTSIAIAALILSAGLSSLLEASRSLVRPVIPQYGIVSLVVVALAACVKFGLGVYLLRTGNRLNASSLTASGTDSVMDGFVSTATCIAGIVYLYMGLRIESLLAAMIALLIIKSGVELLFETVSKLLGERVSPNVAARVEREARAIDEVRLASGLVLFDFGPDQLTGSIHVTVDSQMTIAEFDTVARKVQQHVQETCGVTLMGVTPYPDTAHDGVVREVRATVGRIVWGHDHIVELRGLYADTTTHTVRFDAVAEFGVEDTESLRTHIVEACQQACPGWSFEARVLPDVGD